jgi:acyl-CoA thioester hydrolase
MDGQRAAEPGWSHRFSFRVYWEDTDAAGIVYYANYLRFAERARTEALLAAGVSQTEIRERFGLVLPVREATVRYLAPARLEDEIVVETRLEALGGARIILAQDVLRGGERLAEIRVVIACIDAAGRPRRVPEIVRRAFAPARDRKTA